VLTDHFKRWADALAIPDASAPTMARALDHNLFCYFGLLEQIHTDQGAQFQSQLISNLSKMWGSTRAGRPHTSCKGMGLLSGSNVWLGDSLRSQPLGKSQEEWDLVLPQIMRAYHNTSTPSHWLSQNFSCLVKKQGFLSI